MNIPSELKYTKDHEWIKIEGNTAIVGITDFAQGELGDIVYVDVDTLDDTVEEGDVFGSVEAVKTVSDLFMPLSGEVAEFNEASPNNEFDPKSVKQTLNKWIIGETALVREAVDNSLEQYRFNDAANALYVFVWNKVCDWYVELSKPLIQAEDQAMVLETKETLAWVLDQSYILLHPIMPFITENLWDETGVRKKLLAHAEWPKYSSIDYLNEEANKEMNWVISLIEQIRSVRSEMRVNAGAKIPMIQLSLDSIAQKALDDNKLLIMRLARVESITLASEPPNGWIFGVGFGSLYVSLWYGFKLVNSGQMTLGQVRVVRWRRK